MIGTLIIRGVPRLMLQTWILNLVEQKGTMLALELMVLKKVDNLSRVGGKIKAIGRRTPHINRGSLLVILRLVPIADLTMVVYQKAPQAIQLDISMDLLQKITG
jgi:hypothetical protein